MQPKSRYRVSVTTLEMFRRYLADQVTEKDLIQMLSGKFKGNDYTKVGHAFHAMIERPQDAMHVIYDKKRWKAQAGIMFPEAIWEKAREFSREHPNATYEVPVEKTYSLALYEITVSGRLDAMEGVTGYDHKLVFQPKDISAYLQSCQWTFYCDMVEGLREFRYQVYEVDGFTNLKHTCPYGAILKGLTMEAHDPVKLFPYQTMKADVTHILQAFMNYIEYRKFFQYLKVQPNEIEA